MTKIINLELIREKIDKFYQIASDDKKLYSIFEHGRKDVSFSDKIQKFFDVADGNPEWNV